MRQIRAFSTCLALACCLGLAIVAAAQAEPEFYTKAAIGGQAPSAAAFTFTDGVILIEEHSSKTKIECKKGHGAGEVTGTASVAAITSEMSECEIGGSGLPCENEGAGSKAIELKPLAGELGAISTTTPGLRLRAETGEYLAEFECFGGAELDKWRGAVISELTGASGKTTEEGKIPTSFDDKYAETGGIQKYTKLLGETEGHQLEAVISEGSSSHEELVGQSVTVVMKSEPTDNLGFTL
jgi:hypothetical protein